MGNAQDIYIVEDCIEYKLVYGYRDWYMTPYSPLNYPQIKVEVKLINKCKSLPREAYICLL